MKGCNKACSPIVPRCKLVNDENEKASYATIYKQIVGSLMYMLATRPNMAFSVCLMLTTIQRILRYLKGTLDLGILYKHEGTNDL